MSYVGRRVECLRDIDIFTPAFFVFLQTRLAVAIDRKAILYRGGIKASRIVESDVHVECLVEQMKQDRAVDMTARATKTSQHHAFEFLQEVNTTLVQVLDEKSPGTDTKQFYLHVPHLTEGQYEPFGFSEEEIEAANAKGEELVIGTDQIIGNLRDMMAFEEQAASRHV